MAGLPLFLLLVVSAMADGACKKRDVKVFVEVGITVEDHDTAVVDGVGFYSSLLSLKVDTKCWKASITIFDYVAIQLTDANAEWTRKEDTSKPRENIVKELEGIYSKVKDDLQPRDAAPVIVLVLNKYNIIVDDKLQAASRNLQELGFKFITIGVGAGWKEKDLKEIASSPHRVLLAKEFYSLSPAAKSDVSGRLTELLHDPDKVFENIQTFSSGGPAVTCKNTTVDLGFILDSSGSLKDDYGKEKSFIKSIAQAFDIKKGGTHAGVVTFSDKVKLSIKLSETKDYDEFHEAVNNIPHMNSITRIDLALKKARDELFSTQNGGRPGKKKVLVLLTDGSQTYNKGHLRKDLVDPAPIADEIRAKGIEILVIGIGLQIKEDELKLLAEPKDNYRHAATFTELASAKFAENMTNKICTMSSTPLECERIVDICFLIDSSGSIDEQTDWKTVKNFVRTLANVYKFSETGPRGSVVVFSDLISKTSGYAFTKVVIKLNNKLRATDFGQTVESTPYMGYRTRIDLGFKLINEEVFQPRNGARPNVKKVVILITDGNQNPKKFDPVKASEGLINQNVSIFAVAIGKNIDFGQLNRITRNPQRVIRAADFKTLENQEFLNGVSREICVGGVLDKCCCPTIDDKLKGPLGATLVEVVQKELKKSCKGDCEPLPPFPGPPGLGKSQIVSRKRRSIDLGTDDTEDFEELGMLSKHAKLAGCNIFLNALRKHGILNNISMLIKEQRHVSIFCPVDDAYENIYSRADLAANERNILLNHVGLKSDKHGTIFRTLLPGGQVIFNSIGKGMGKVSTEASQVDVVVSLTDTRNGIVVIKDIILPTQHGVLDVLKSNANVSIFYEILAKSRLADVFKESEIDKVCFSQDMCLSPTPSMMNKLKSDLDGQFTICAPSNNMFLSMKKSELKPLMMDPVARKEFLQEYVFLGFLDTPESDGRKTAYSLSSKHFVISAKMSNNTMILKHANGRKFEVKNTVAAREGIVHVVDMMV